MSHSTRSLGDVAGAPVWINVSFRLHDSELIFFEFHRFLKTHSHVFAEDSSAIVTLALSAPYVRTYIILIYAVVDGFES